MMMRLVQQEMAASDNPRYQGTGLWQPSAHSDVAF